MSPKNSSLAFQETLKTHDPEQSIPIDFEPELRVIVNAKYSKTPLDSSLLVMSSKYRGE